ncbi:hypothetical protein EXIGLDRAFT_470440 [Exidia glandulosa HHB12029]|uniref:Uncharacterized protein n=1 Tax=Exidia glandulosa HHB12029 TaxID=1314781 RepID=A0A166AVG9_EXIGL|nr:hypothetical protein EXIGLDRAFT_470440 [Exidia glandulosa HHB12029]
MARRIGILQYGGSAATSCSGNRGTMCGTAKAQTRRYTTSSRMYTPTAVSTATSTPSGAPFTVQRNTFSTPSNHAQHKYAPTTFPKCKLGSSRIRATPSSPHLTATNPPPPRRKISSTTCPRAPSFEGRPYLCSRITF